MSVFHFITLTTWELLVLDGFLNSTFVLSPQKKAPTSHFLAHNMKEKKIEEKKTTSYMYTVSGTIY